MPNDAKLGLVVGVGLVIAVAVMYFRKDMAMADPAEAAASATVKPKAGNKSPGNGKKPVKARPTALVPNSEDVDDEGDGSEVDQPQLPAPQVLQPVGTAIPDLLPSSSQPAEQPAEQEGNDADQSQ